MNTRLAGRRGTYLANHDPSRLATLGSSDRGGRRVLGASMNIHMHMYVDDALTQNVDGPDPAARIGGRPGQEGEASAPRRQSRFLSALVHRRRREEKPRRPQAVPWFNR